MHPAIVVLAAALPLLALFRLLLARRERVLDRAWTEQGEIFVRDHGEHREMVVLAAREMVWTRASRVEPGLSGFGYVDLLHLAAALAASRRRALFLGCGGAVGPRRLADLYPGIDIDIVEREPAVVTLARRHFELDAIPRTSVHLGDGAAFVAAAAPGSWDVVIVDAYGAMDLPDDMAREAFFRALHAALRPGGAVAMNVVGRLAGPGPVRTVAEAARVVFGDVRLVPVVEIDEEPDLAAPRNVVVLGRRGDWAAA